MEYMGEENEARIFPRDCFSCGKQMIPVDRDLECGDVRVWCKGCDVYEDGTVTGRWTYNPDPFPWGDEAIPFLDHSKVHFPSPA